MARELSARALEVMATGDDDLPLVWMARELLMARRFRAVHDWDRWPTPEEFKPMEEAQADLRKHLEARREYLARQPKD